MVIASTSHERITTVWKGFNRHTPGCMRTTRIDKIHDHISHLIVPSEPPIIHKFPRQKKTHKWVKLRVASRKQAKEHCALIWTSYANCVLMLSQWRFLKRWTRQTTAHVSISRQSTAGKPGPFFFLAQTGRSIWALPLTTNWWTTHIMFWCIMKISEELDWTVS